MVGWHKLDRIHQVESTPHRTSGGDRDPGWPSIMHDGARPGAPSGLDLIKSVGKFGQGGPLEWEKFKWDLWLRYETSEFKWWSAELTCG